MVPLWVAFVSFVYAEDPVLPSTTTAEPTAEEEVHARVLLDEDEDYLILEDEHPAELRGRQLQNGSQWQASDGATFTKIPDSAGRSCSNEQKIIHHQPPIFLRETFENAPMNSSSAVLMCADECERYTNPAHPGNTCVGFELRDISAVGLPGVQCKLFSGICELDDTPDDEIRGQYLLTKQPGMKFPVVPVAAAAGVITVILASFMCRSGRTDGYHGAEEEGFLEGEDEDEVFVD